MAQNAENLVYFHSLTQINHKSNQVTFVLEFRSTAFVSLTLVLLLMSIDAKIYIYLTKTMWRG